MSGLRTALFAALAVELPRALELRRQIHADPRVAGDEHTTMKLITSLLPDHVEIHPVADAGALIRAGGPGSPVGIRAELDALPVEEDTGSPWASQRPGVMHACGHDVHSAALWAVLRAVAATPSGPPLLAVFQPREETYPSGARDIISSGLLRQLDCPSMIGVHVQPVVDSGVVACVPGPVNASSDEFSIVVSGKSGHSAYPHRTHDPVVTLANVVMALQSIASRSVDPMEPVVLGVSMLQAGHAANTVPGTAEARGTVRALSPTARETVLERLNDISVDIAHAHGCEANVEIHRGDPVLVNDEDLTTKIADHLRDNGIATTTRFRSAGSDDFSHYVESMPSSMLFIGTEARSSLHTPTFLPTDADVRRVAETMMHALIAATS
ncbi:M20 family metallopeptidase [Amycolatopsis sp. GM8]|uniref:M20 metallopeptidase family protein n=1 Tax=Amycolatopsis sp. GM8 TaxID=2896530 RepID=UPI001F180CF9|nr:M20 family metallopeptidase [Amycolatopsis sp. GM8]